MVDQWMVAPRDGDLGVVHGGVVTSGWWSVDGWSVDGDLGVVDQRWMVDQSANYG